MKFTLYHKLVILLWAAFIFASCTEEGAEFPVRPGNGANLELRLQVPGLSKPSFDTYAIDAISENFIKELDVLVFKVHNGNEEYLYTQQFSSSDFIDILSNGSEKFLTINLDTTGLMNNGTEIRIVALANVRSMIPVITVGEKKEDVLKNITFSISGNKWKTNSNVDFDPFPMWGESARLELDPNKNIAPVQMIRALAKVEVGLNYTGDEPQGLTDFKLQKVYVYNINTNASLVPLETTYSTTLTRVTSPSVPSPAGKVVGPIVYAAANDKEVLGQIYLAEAEAGSELDKVNAPCVVIEGLYKGVTTFYRIDLLKEVNGVKSYIPVMRNYRYRLNVRTVQGPGWNTLTDAFNKPAINDYIQVDVDLVDESKISVATDGQHYLKLSKDSVNVFYYTATPGLTIDFRTDALGGWQAIPQDSWIHITSAASGPANTDVTLTFKVDATTVERTGSILIEAARIRKVIKVVQAYCDTLPANIGSYNNEELEVFMAFQPIGHTWYEYANVGNSYNTGATPPLPAGSQCAPPRPFSCAALDAGGKTDWRLPSFTELQAMVDYALQTGGKKIIDYKSSSWGAITSTSNSTYISLASASVYNTSTNQFKNWGLSTTNQGLTYQAGLGYTTGDNYKNSILGVFNGSYSTLYSNVIVKCVRGGTSNQPSMVIPAGTYGISNDLTVMTSDQLPNYNWYEYANRENNDNTNALPAPSPPRPNSCAALNLNGGTNGYTDWRLPTKVELYAVFTFWNTLEKQANAGIDNSNYYFTSENGWDNTCARTVNVSGSYINTGEYTMKSATYTKARCVRSN